MSKQFLNTYEFPYVFPGRGDFFFGYTAAVSDLYNFSFNVGD
jgi:hypothetical protein